MEKNKKWTRIVWIIGIVALLAGSLDPLEGSVVIAIGSGLLAVSAFFKNDRHWKIFLATFIMIAIGVVLLFGLSALGGFGGSSSLSWWWGLLIVPYPVGWLANIVILIIRAVKKPAKQAE
jgi:hypothetical protein